MGSNAAHSSGCFGSCGGGAGSRFGVRQPHGACAVSGQQHFTFTVQQPPLPAAPALHEVLAVGAPAPTSSAQSSQQRIVRKRDIAVGDSIGVRRRRDTGRGADRAETAAPWALASSRDRCSARRRRADDVGMLRPLAASFVLLLTGCTTALDSDLRPLLAQQHFPVTQDATPADAESIGMFSVTNTGFYLFSFIPVEPVSLQEALEAMVRRGRELGGEGISNVTVRHDNTRSFVSLSLVFLPDWLDSVTVTGTAWRRKQR